MCVCAVDQNGDVVLHAIYDEWGVSLTATRLTPNYSGLDNTNNYTGYTWDDTLEIYYAQARFYDPATHRFTQQDPIQDGENWYAYVKNNPLTHTDPWGLARLSIEQIIDMGGSGGPATQKDMPAAAPDPMQVVSQPAVVDPSYEGILSQLFAAAQDTIELLSHQDEIIEGIVVSVIQSVAGALQGFGDAAKTIISVFDPNTYLSRSARPIYDNTVGLAINQPGDLKQAIGRSIRDYADQTEHPDAFYFGMMIGDALSLAVAFWGVKAGIALMEAGLGATGIGLVVEAPTGGLSTVAVVAGAATAIAGAVAVVGATAIAAEAASNFGSHAKKFAEEYQEKLKCEEASEGAGKGIPDKARDVANQVKSKNGSPPQGYKGGRTYNNQPVNGGQKLPEGINYKEYDVNPYVKGQNRGAERIVIGDDGSVWYTNDHYQTFTKMD